MNDYLRILLIDDNPDDRALVIRELRREFPDLQVQQIIEAKGFAQALGEGDFDLVITDYQLRWTDGLAVLRAVKARWPDCPVVMFTATGSEEIAVEAMKAGLDDYVIKSPKHFVRLPAAVRYALKRAEDSIERKRAEEALRVSRASFHNVVEKSADGIIVVDQEGVICFVNSALTSMFGRGREELVGELFGFPITIGESAEIDIIRRGGEIGTGEMRVVETKWMGERAYLTSIRDITERKRAEEAEARARANAERIEQLERELRSLERLSTPPSTAVTAPLFGVVPLRESMPDIFSEFVQRYGELMNLTLEQRAHKAEHDISGELRSIGERLGLLRAGPRDVVEIHSNALKRKTNLATSQRAQAYVEEGRLMVLELMGYLAAFYRTYAAAAKRKT
jgi:DNA-binding NarL/FixJ family response regulator